MLFARVFQPVSSSKLRKTGWIGAIVAVFALVLTLCPQKTFAQADQGAIIGLVTDSTGAVIPGAQVTLTDTDTGLVLQVKSNATGDYYFSPIKTGHYTVKATASGFETTEQTNIVVHVQDRLNIPLKLTPGNVSETVTVTSTAPLMQTQTAETATDVDSKFLNDAPLANRNWIFIAQEAPGVTPQVGRGAGNGDFSSNGQHEEQNNYMLDGVDNNTMNSDYINGSTYNLAPPPDAIAEFKMETSNYSAEIGRGHGAVLNATTKSGTNEFHGDVWLYNRNTIFDALNWTQNPGSTAAPFHLNQFGATLGGPILHNRLFFFGDFQESRYAMQATPVSYSVPTARMRQGDFSELLNPTLNNNTCPVVLFQPNVNKGSYVCSKGAITTAPSGSLQTYGSSQNSFNGTNFAQGQNVFGPSQLDPVALNILRQYPCPNASPAGTPNHLSANGGWQTGNCNNETNLDTGATNGNYVVNLPSWSDPIQWDGRLDWNISARDQAYFRIDYQHIINTLDSPLGPILDGYSGYNGHNQSYLSENYMLSETHTFSPTLINEFRFAFNWGNDSNLQYNYNKNESGSLGLNNVPFNEAEELGGLPSVSISGLQAFGTHANDPAHEGQDIYQILDNLTKIKGNHSLKVGFEFMPIRFYSTAAPNPLGSYSFNGTYTGVSGQSNTGSGIADFIAQGTLAGGGYTGTDNMNGGSISTFSWQNFEFGYAAGYIQDDWKVTQKLTVNLGVRDEYFTPKKEMAGQWNNWVAGTGYMSANGEVGSSTLVFPSSQSNLKLSPTLMAMFAADNVSIAYSNNPRLVSFPKFNWSPRVGASYQIDDKTVVRTGAGVFYGAFEPGGGAALTQNPPYILTANLPTMPSCANGAYCASQYANGNSLENGLGGFIAAGGVENYATNPTIEEVDPVMHTPYTVNYNLSVQRAFWNQTTATVSYVGSIGRHLVTLTNGPGMPMAITTGSQQQNGMSRTPHFNSSQWMQWTGGSSYSALQAEVQKHYSNGLSFLGTYTWGQAFDNTNDMLGGDLGGYKQAQLIPDQYEWSHSGYDIRQRAVINTDYDLPFGVGRQFVNHPGILDKIIGGWRTDMEWWAQTGQPFTNGINRQGSDQYGNGYGNVNGGISNNSIKIGNAFSTSLPLPNQSNPATASGITACPTAVRNKLRWYNPCAFADPVGDTAAQYTLAPYETGTFSFYSAPVGYEGALADGTYSNIAANGKAANSTNGPAVAAAYVTGYANVKQFFGSPKNQAPGPGNWRLNASLFKDFRTFHEQYLEFRADAFNVLNHPSFGNPSNSGTNPSANAMITTTGANQANTIDARFFQLSGKYVF